MCIRDSAYTDGAYSKGVQVDSKPGGCCGKAYWTISSKDYTVPAGEEDLGGVGKSAVANMRKNGKVCTCMRLPPVHARQLIASR